KRSTAISYDNRAYDFAMRMWLPDDIGAKKRDKYIAERVFADRDIKGIRKFIFGPLEAIAEHVEVVAVGNSEYLESQIVRIGGEDVLNLGYVYGQQGGILLNKLLREIAAKGGGEVDVYFFGRVGMLEGKVNGLVRPVGIIDQSMIESGTVIPMNNRLGERGLIYNVHSVLDETREELEYAKLQGCVCVEMEELYIVLSVIANASNYPNLNINNNFLGFGSDEPLPAEESESNEGKTLADEPDCSEGKMEAARIVVEDIER
ncbi:hypothetical protein ACFL0V_03835, partial [Nanoarchaeota archaeon]